MKLSNLLSNSSSIIARAFLGWGPLGRSLTPAHGGRIGDPVVAFAEQTAMSGKGTAGVAGVQLSVPEARSLDSRRLSWI